MTGHTHDGLDWGSRITAMRAADVLAREANRQVAARLVADLPTGPTVVEIGPGTGGMSAALAAALADRGGGRLVLADAVPELLAMAADAAVDAAADAAVDPAVDMAADPAVDVAAQSAGVDAAAADPAADVAAQSAGVDGRGQVDVVPVQLDAAADGLAAMLPAADLVWASQVVHHLPDQQRALARLARVLKPGGVLALAEDGLAMRCLPWDLGIGEPGLQERLSAARAAWFATMRTSMDGVARLTVGWNRALVQAGLEHTATFTYLIDYPAPAPAAVRAAVVEWLSFLASITADGLSESDRQALDSLLDPAGAAYVGARDDVYMLVANTVYCGRRVRA